MSATIRFAPGAFRDTCAAATWWRTHREAHPDLFDEELRKALDFIRLFPEASPKARTRRYRGARVRVMKETGHLVVYRYSGASAEILAVLVSKKTSTRP